MSRGLRSDTADAITVLALGVAAVVVVAIAAGVRVVDTFRPAGVAIVVDVDDVPAAATVDSGSATISGYVENLLVVVPDVGVGARIALGASICLWTVAALVVIGAVMFLAWSFLRGRLFAPDTVRSLDLIGWTVVLSAFGIALLDRLGSNGVLAELGAPGGGPLHPIEFWSLAPAWAIGTAVGLLSVAFRRGVRLEQDTRGLV